jgi:hypothetical protein
LPKLHLSAYGGQLGNSGIHAAGPILSLLIGYKRYIARAVIVRGPFLSPVVVIP